MNTAAVDTAVATTAAVAPGGAAYTVAQGDTLFGIAQASGVDLSALVTANGWADGASHAIFPGDRIVLPEGANLTVSVPTASATVPEANGQVMGGYSPTGVQYAGPDYGDQTSAITDSLADGIYWGDANAAKNGVEFTVVQMFFGDACFANVGTGEEDCLADRGSAGPTGTIALAPDADVTVVYVPPAVITSYRITASELTRLVAALPPSADAPSDFSYVSFPFILTVRNGVAIAADQRYVS